MPELPEVELVAGVLRRLVCGKVILRAELLRERLAPETAPEEFSDRLGGASIRSVSRRGKHILFDLSNSRTLITHLRMTGRFSLLKDRDENPKFTHAVFYLNGGDRLIFSDQRHFGLMKIAETARLFETPELKILAPEPFSAEFSPGYLRGVLKASRRTVKEILMDQSKVCGLGNIYASEALFRSRINPLKRGNEVSAAKAGALFDSIRSVLAEAIEHSADADADLEAVEANYFGGTEGNPWRVYDREGLPCATCKKPIKRVTQGGRSSYFCSNCQRR